MILYFFSGFTVGAAATVYCSDVNGLIWTIMPLNHRVAALKNAKKYLIFRSRETRIIRNENSRKSELKSNVQSRFEGIESISPIGIPNKRVAYSTPVYHRRQATTTRCFGSIDRVNYTLLTCQYCKYLDVVFAFSEVPRNHFSSSKPQKYEFGFFDNIVIIIQGK